MSQRGRRQRTPQRQQRTPPPFEISEHPEFKSWYVTGAFGGISPTDARMILYLDRLEPEVVSGGTPGQMRITKINRELQVELHMSPVEFKVLAQWMARHVQQFEENFHEIQLGPQEASDEDNPLVQ